MVQITNYEGTELVRVALFLETHPAAGKATVEELLKTCNLSFV